MNASRTSIADSAPGSDLLQRFEAGLDPQNLDASAVPAKVLGYGEISAIFSILEAPDWAVKRLPLFETESTARRYEHKHRQYCRLLSDAGLKLPDWHSEVVRAPGRPVCLYIAQRRIEGRRFAHRRIASSVANEANAIFARVCGGIERVWNFNRNAAPELELALDGQISNWAIDDHGLKYVDTGTPLFRKQGREQFDPEPFLRCVPAFLRWILRLFFLQDVLERYYDPRRVYTDLCANLYKEQRPDLIRRALGVVNDCRPAGEPPLTAADVAAYYREDRLIWSLFLAFRRLDRWMTTRLRRRRYEFILPGRIRR